MKALAALCIVAAVLLWPTKPPVAAVPVFIPTSGGYRLVVTPDGEKALIWFPFAPITRWTEGGTDG